MARNRLLIVDDERVVLDLLQTYISSMDYEIDTAGDGLAALDLLKINTYDIVLTDMIMPKMDGMELLKHIRQFYPQTDVIVLTGYDDSYNYTDVINAGASDFIAKPFQSDELRAKLRRVAREQKFVRQLKEVTDALEKQVAEKDASLEEAKKNLSRTLERLKDLQAQTIIAKYGKPRY